MRTKINADKCIVGKRDNRGQLAILRRRWNDVTKMELQEII